MLQVVSSFGVSTSRFVSGFLKDNSRDRVGKKGVNDYSFVASLGSTIVEWELRSKEQKQQVQVDHDMIVCLVSNEPQTLFVTCDFSGHVTIWNSNWERFVNYLFLLIL